MLCPRPPTPPASSSDELAGQRLAEEWIAQITWLGELAMQQECRPRPLAGLGREFGEALGRGPGLCLQFSPGGGGPIGLSHPHAIKKKTAFSQDTCQG